MEIVSKTLPKFLTNLSEISFFTNKKIKFHLSCHNKKKFDQGCSNFFRNDESSLKFKKEIKHPVDPVSLRGLCSFEPEKKLTIMTDIKSQAMFSTNMSTSCKPNPGRHAYHEETECAINQQVFAELNAAFAYLSMACYFGRTEVALPGSQGFFIKMHEEEMEHARLFINYQLMRGGVVKWFPITIPESDEFNSIVKALSVATEMEKLVKEKLQAVYETAEKHQDLELMDLISKFMADQNSSICEMARFQIRASKMCAEPSGEFLFDKELFKGWVKKPDEKNKYK